MPILSLLIFLPALAAMMILIFADNAKANYVRLFTLLITLASLFLSCILYLGFNNASAAIQFSESYQWIEVLNIRYTVGVDGITMPLVCLTSFTHLLVVLAAWRLIKDNVAQYFAIFLLIQSAITGVFCALDAMLFYVFWEAMLIPMYLCIGIWGSEQRSYAAIKFFLYTFLGSTLLLIAILFLAFKANSFYILDFYPLQLTLSQQLLIFAAFFLAFAVKVPMWPLHTWLPDAHTQAPAGGSVILAALMLKVGAYGFFRFCLPIVPDACAYVAVPMIVLSLWAIGYIGFIALAQSDMKRLIAYSSVAHMGFVTLGLFVIYKVFSITGDLYDSQLALEGAMVQMISHAFGSGAMFLAFGIVYDKLHTRVINNFGGLAKKMPYFAAFFLLFCLTNVGVPGTAGFVGEFMVILGVFKASFWLSFFAALTLIVAATYTLSMYKRVFYGEYNESLPANLTDISALEQMTLWLLAIAIFVIGLFPEVILAPMHASIANLLGLALQSKIIL